MQNFLVTNEIEPEDRTQKFYDRIADIHNLAFKINGYRTSAAKCFRSLKLDVNADSSVLDVGCGTGLATLAFYEAGYRPKETIAIDLSFRSLKVAKEQFETNPNRAVRRVRTLQGNLLSMPFEDEKFDLILSVGALEYVSLEQGLAAFARVLKPGGVLVLIPIRQSLVGSMLEVLYNFKMHKLSEIRQAAGEHFQIVANHKFAITEPIGWSKTVYLLRKK